MILRKLELKISNKQLYKMKKIDNFALVYCFSIRISKTKNFLLNDENYFFTTSKDRYNLYDKTLPTLSLENEKKKGFDFLRK